MKSILLIGVGRFGRQVAAKLYEMRHEVLAVDLNEDRIHEVLPFVTDSQIGDATDTAFLRTLGVRNFDVCIVTISSNFQSSLEAASLLKELGARLVVARAGSDVHEKFLLRNGADEVVYPERQLANWTAVCYSSEQVFDYIELSRDYAIFEVSVPPGWVGKSLGELDLRRRRGLNVVAYKINNEVVPSVTPDRPLTAEERLLVLGQKRDIQKCFHV